MKKKDKIEDLFRKKIGENSSSDDWSNPPDLAWSKAQQIINDEIAAKKRKRRFFILPFIILGLALPLYFLISPSSSKIQIPKEEVQSELDTNMAIANEPQSSMPKSNELVSYNELGNETVSSLNLDHEAVSQKQSTIDNDFSAASHSSREEKVVLSSKKRNNKEVGTEQGSINHQRESQSENALALDINVRGNLNDEASRIQNTEEVNIQNIEPALDGKEEVNRRHLHGRLSDLIALDFKIEGSDREILPPSYAFVTPAIEPMKRTLRHYEFGLGYSFYPFNPFRTLEEEDFGEEIDELIIGSSYFNTNVYFNAKFNRKWSLGTGAYFTHMGFDISYKTFSFFESGNIENSLDPYLNIENPSSGLGIGNRAASSVQNISIIGENAQINFFSDANLNEGDELKINGQIPVRMSITTIPLTIHRHWHFRNFEYQVFSGFSLNHLLITLREPPITIYSGDELVADDVLFQPEREFIILPNFILGGGIKYHIDGRWNISASYNLNPIAVSFSKVYLGLNYSF